MEGRRRRRRRRRWKDEGAAGCMRTAGCMRWAAREVRARWLGVCGVDRVSVAGEDNGALGVRCEEDGRSDMIPALARIAEMAIVMTLYF